MSKILNLLQNTQIYFVNNYKLINHMNLISRDITWEYIKQQLPNEPENKKNLQIIYQYAKQICGNESKELVDSTASYIFQIFLNETMVLQKHIQMLKQLFGAVSSLDVNNVFEVIY